MERLLDINMIMVDNLQKEGDGHVCHKARDSGDDFDIMGAQKLGRKHLVRCGNGQKVDVQSLRGKIVGIFFSTLDSKHPSVKHGASVLLHVYNILKTNDDPSRFEIVFVAVPKTLTCPKLYPSTSHRFREFNKKYHNPSAFAQFTSPFPWLAIPFPDRVWRSHLETMYLRTDSRSPPLLQLTIIDNTTTREDKNKGVPVLTHCALNSFSLYGPQIFPYFTVDREIELGRQHNDLAKQTSMMSLLGSATRDYLIDRHFQRVPISHLETMDVVALFMFDPLLPASRPFLEQLVNFYNQCKSDEHKTFEVVFINFQHGLGYRDENAFRDALAKMPWLALPYGDYEKSWLLHRILADPMYNSTSDGCWMDHPCLFIKAKGETLLDPYGSRVFSTYGIEAYPFTRRAASRFLFNKLKLLTFGSFLEEARLLGLDFASLIRHKEDSICEKSLEDVSLSTVMDRRPGRNLLLLFASPEYCSKQEWNSLIKAYSACNASFEVIFVSVGNDTSSFLNHFSVMPWFAFRRPLRRREFANLVKRTIEFDDCHFTAFGPDGHFITLGFLPYTSKDLDIRDVELKRNLFEYMIEKHGWLMDVDHVPTRSRVDEMDWLDV